jgi:hypothetical protein
LSHKATSYVFELTHFPDGEPLTRDDKILLFALADHHNFSTNEAFPSVARLAKLTIMSERHARDLLRRAERHGMIETIPGGGRGKTSSYVFTAMKEKGGTECLVKEEVKSAPIVPSNESGNSAPCLPGIDVNSANTRQKGGTGAYHHKEEPKNLEPTTKPSAKRRKRDDIFSEYSEDVKLVVNTLSEIWPKTRPGTGTPIRIDLPLFAGRVEGILKAHKVITAPFLIDTGRMYVEERKEFPHAPEYFFGPGKQGGDGPPWRHYAKMLYHEQQAKAVAQ